LNETLENTMLLSSDKVKKVIEEILQF